MRGVEQIPWLYDLGMALQDRFGGLRRWREILVASATGRVLEVGCGTGRNLPLYPPGVVTGVDPSMDVLGAARKRAPSARLVAGSAEFLPFPDASFDTIVSSLVFCSVPRPDVGLAEVRRVLAPGGTLAMIEHVRSSRPWVGRAQDVIQPAWTCVLGGCHPNRDTEAAVERAGFVIDPVTRRSKGIMRMFFARTRV